MKFSAIITGTIFMSSFAISSCSIFNKSGVSATTKQDDVKKEVVASSVSSNEDASGVESLLGCWSVTEINGQEVVVNGENHPQFTFKAMPEAPGAIMVIAFNGCNYLNGSWKVEDSKLMPFSEFISTMKNCPDAPYEFALNQALNETTGFSLDEPNTLILKSGTGRTVMTLRKRNLNFLNGAWKVTTINGVPVPENADVKIVIDVDECKIHGRAGCNIVNGTVVVNLDKGNGLEFKDLATTMMMCPYIDTERQFLLALEEVSTCTEGATPDQAVMKSSSGKDLLSLVRIPADQLSDD